MRLIATMGASGINQKHTYKVNDKSYTDTVSFMALLKAYNIDDIIVIGTKQSEKSIASILKDNPNIQMVVIESTNVEDVFQKSLEYIAKDTILDLTQGYRHYPMLTLLASVFLQNSKSKNIKDIFYAQIEDENCQAYKESCTYRFTSLIKYLDIANMARVINTFNKTLLTLDYEVHDEEFQKLKKSLEDLTQKLFSNDFEESSKKAKNNEKRIDKILKDKYLDVVKEHLCDLKNEMKTIQKLKAQNESETLLNVSEYFLEKDILLHAVTLLYESMVAFLDENVKNNKCNTVINRRGEEVPASIFQRRNCLKLNMGDCRNNQYKNKIAKCQKFSNLLRKIDGLRNTSAHAHTTGSYQADLKDELKKAIEFLTPIIKNLPIEEKVSSLEDMFNNR